ncbi:hypothetical protein K4B79_07770 [Streptomyces lincolnensis]|uniref:hypothetical protein n=1 Tax=Streptomyces lincolnensis TaxID=1915 RepID=UPI001E63B62F|nr:hypothetical protein [Streptomyces lincolnensis]MCD7438126.1 hypothetical protein [Streptomyces lincolnensis]
MIDWYDGAAAGLDRTVIPCAGDEFALERWSAHATVACLGGPGHPGARGLYYGVGFRRLSRDAPLIRTATAG